MKLISTKAKEGKTIISNDAVFDPYLAKLGDVDKEEMLITLVYDAMENGSPLGLPIQSTGAELTVKLTSTGIHTSLLITDFVDCATSDKIYEDYGDGLGSIEFNVRMTDPEKLQLMQRIAILLLQAE